MKNVADYRKEIKKLKAEHEAAITKMYNQYVEMQKDNASENKFKIANLQLQVDKSKEYIGKLNEEVSILKQNNDNKDIEIRNMSRRIRKAEYIADISLKTLDFITK